MGVEEVVVVEEEEEEEVEVVVVIIGMILPLFSRDTPKYCW